jgi:hypothetical protein
MLWLLVIANSVPSLPILVTLMMEAVHSETLVLTRATQHNIPQYGILHGTCCIWALSIIMFLYETQCFGD